MVNDSTKYGWLIPERGPSERSIEDVFTGMLLALCGLEKGLVRPRWQAKPPYMPSSKENWCAFGIMGESAPGGSVWHGEGHSRLMADDEFSVLFSFYGPNARGLARALRDGLWIEQNRAVLRMENNIALVRIGVLTPVPELVDGRWLARCDLSVDFVRGPEIRRRERAEGDVEIRDLASAKPCGLCGRSR